MCYRLAQFLTVTYNDKHCVLDLSLLDLLLIFFIWMCHFDLVVSLDVEPDIQAFDYSCKMFFSCLLVSI